MLYVEKYDLVLITETWLHSDITNGLLDPRGIYTVCRKDRNGSHHGGVAILMHRNLHVAEVITDDAFDDLEIKINCDFWSYTGHHIMTPLLVAMLIYLLRV